MKNALYIGLISLLIFIPIASIFLWIVGDDQLVPGASMAGAGMLAIWILYVFLSFGTVKPDQVAMLTFFGDPVKDLDKGLYFAPLGIYAVDKELGTIIQQELPADPEKIFREEGPVPKDMFPPIRILFGPPDPSDTELIGNPYNISMSVEVTPVVGSQITSLMIFRQTIGTIANLRQILADKAVGVFVGDFALVTPARAMQNLKQTSLDLLLELQSTTQGQGFEVRDAYVKPFGFSHPLNTSVVEVSIADQKAKAYTMEQTAQINMARERLLNLGLLKPILSGGNIIGYEQVVEINSAIWAEALKNSNLQFLSLDPKGIEGVMAAILSAKGGAV